jgi:branched-chain amino acid transport system substrate-binding protein
MKTLARSLRIAAVLCLALGSTVAPGFGQGPQPYELNVIMPMTGYGAFLGKGEKPALDAIEKIVNKSGGIAGRPVKFVIHDDQSNPQVDVQLANSLISQHVPVILGSSLVALCGAMMPLVKDGPVLYCFSPGVHPEPGSYVFSSSVSTTDLIPVAVRYFRERGLTRFAVITSTDASGQDAERAINAVFALPENKGLSIVDREHFGVSDISVSAQMARIKAANPQVLIAWSTGTPAGTLLRGASEAGITIPILTTNGNLTYAQMAQYSSFMPKELYFPGVPCVAPNQVTDKATKNAVTTYQTALRAEGVKPDFMGSTAWDPAMIVITALRALGPNATAAQLRQYIANIDGWVGVNGRYDFRSIPQRGLDQSAVIMVRWNQEAQTWVGVSKPGGTPLAQR